MDSTLQYCSARRDIEGRFAALATKLFDLTNKLHLLIGHDANAFRTAKLDCRKVRGELAELKLSLKSHRAAHKC